MAFLKLQILAYFCYFVHEFIRYKRFTQVVECGKIRCIPLRTTF